MPFTVTSCTTPIWADAEHTMIVCSVKFTEFPQAVPFRASANDPADHGKALFKDLVGGKYGAIGAYVAPAVQQSTPKSAGTQKL